MADSGEGLNPVWLANNKLRRRRYDDCIAICTTILEKNPYDQVGAPPPLYFLKTYSSLFKIDA
jgi:hypothetical protein